LPSQPTLRRYINKQGSSQGHKTSRNTVESLISCTEWNLPTPGGNIWNFVDTLFVYCMPEEIHRAGKGEISKGLSE
jgi:hypothetical protein